MMFSAIQPFETLAMVGIDSSWAGSDGLDGYERMIYEARHQFVALEGGKTAVSAAACESLLTNVARRSVQDAEAQRSGALSAETQHAGLRIAALTACALPVNLSWSWAASLMDLSAQANPLAAALVEAQRMLASGEADLVVFAAAAGLPVLPADAPLAPAAVTAFGFDRGVHGWRLGEGAGAVALMLHSRALREGRRVYAVIRSMAAAPARPDAAPLAALPTAPLLDDVRGCCRAALDGAGVTPDQVGYLEAFASGVDALDGIEISGMVQSYRLPAADLTTALGSGQSSTGYLGAAAGLAGLIRAALCLYHRIIPGAADWSAPKLPALWRGAPFYVSTESRAWFQKPGGAGRLAGLNVVGRAGSFAHLILGEPQEQPSRPNRALGQGGFALFPLAGSSLDELLGQLEDLQRSLAFATSLTELAAECAETAGDNVEAPYALSIVGHTHEEVRREIELAIKAVPVAFEKNGEWQTPAGSYFTAEPAGRLGQVAFVYPGAFNSYPGVGKDLFRLFPDLHEHMGSIAADVGRALRERMLYPRSLAALSKEELTALEGKLLADPIAMLISGTAVAILYTHVLRETFKVCPAASFGYSLGENSMMYAAGVWGQGDSASARLEESRAFRIRLAGPQLSIREHWGLPADENTATDAPLWANYLVMAAPEKVQAALEKEPRVYLTHINTPRQVVIGGDPQACKRVLADLHCSSLQAPFDYALHCEVMRSEYDGLADLHNWPIEHIPDLRMYSAADYAPVAIEQAELAQKMAQMLTSPLDFPRLIRQVYDDGARIFIEAGAGSNCARWIDESLKGSPHLALSMNRRGTDDYATIVRMLARLHSHRVPLDLSALYQSAYEKVSQ